MNEVSKLIIRNIKKISTETSLSINELRIVVALERIVSRIESDEKLSNYIIFKGGFVLFKVYGSSRFTRDIDAIGKDISLEELKVLVPQALVNDQGDGIWFGNLKIQELTEQGDYGGLRFSLSFQIGDAPEDHKINHLSRVHFDIGIGDFVPSNISKTKNSLIANENESISWKVYPPEYIFSEKLQTVVKRGEANSRAKDIYDLIQLFKLCDKKALNISIKNTFERRETKIPQSFEKYIGSLETSLISRSWGSIQLLDDDLDFDTSWETFKSICSEIDH